MIKKLILGVIVLGLTILLLPVNTQASDLTIINGLDFNLSDNTGVEFEFNYDLGLHKLNIVPIDASYISSGNIMSFVGSGTIFNSVIEDLGIDIQTQTYGVEYVEDIGFELYVDSGSTINEVFDYVVFSGIYDDYYYKIPSNTETLNINFEFAYILDYDEPNYVWSDSFTKDIYINNVLFPYVTDVYTDWATLEIYLVKLLPNEQNWYEYSTFNVWMGYGEDSLQPNLPFTYNYFVKYVNEFIAPYANSELDLSNKITDYVNMIKTTGIVIDLPQNYSINLFVPAYYQNGIDYWYEILGEFEQVTITIPDLVVDGSVSTVLGEFVYDGEIWGDTLNYNVDGVNYTFDLVDEFDNTIPPIFTVRLSTTYFLVTFNTTGGNAIPSQWVEINKAPVRPDNPVRANYTFCTWTSINTLSTVVDDDFICPAGPNQFNSLFTVTKNTTFYARWQTVRQTVTLVNNGGVSKIYSGWNGSTLLVPYNEIVANNLNNVPFNDMVTRTGYSIAGWYLDSELTILFNPNTPIQENITIYAKWVQGDIELDDIGLIDSILDSLGLNNMGGYILMYIIIIIILFSASLLLGLPPMVLIIELIAVTSLFMFMGMFTLWAIILIILAIALGVLIEIRR